MSASPQIEGSPAPIKAQPGPQEEFLSSDADIAVYGGAAGGGKTFAALLEPLRHISNPNFRAVIFRRTSTQVFSSGGLWDEAGHLYPQLGAEERVASRTFLFPSGAQVVFAHLKDEKNKYDHQGGQYPLIIWDELTHFTQSQFFYLMSRNRAGACEGVRPYIRATCNPDANSWVKKFLAPWVDTKYPGKKAESGEKRWFVRLAGEIVHLDTKEDVERMREAGHRPKSLTFVRAMLEDNKILCERDPDYKASLMALPPIERARLLNGSWDAKEEDKFFLTDWIQYTTINNLPRMTKIIRYWDLAGTRLEDNPQACETAGVKLGQDERGNLYILDVFSMYGRPDEVMDAVTSIADKDGPEVEVWMEQEPGSAALAVRDSYARALSHRRFHSDKVSANKAVRHQLIQTNSKNQVLYWLRAAWNHDLRMELDEYPSMGLDKADALAGAIASINKKTGFAFV